MLTIHGARKRPERTARGLAEFSTESEPASEQRRVDWPPTSFPCSTRVV
ncbi:MAG TPA: hypothetical protein VF666_17685 [Pyrinomonadaceae bacterium]